MSKLSPEALDHLRWLGYLQPTGLVVSVPGLLAAQAQVQRNIVPQQQALKGLTRPRSKQDASLVVPYFPDFAFDFLAWPADLLAGGPGGPELPRDLDFSLSDYAEVLSPTFALADPDSPGQWLLLVKEIPEGADFDALPDDQRDGHHWHASPQERFERLLKERQIPIGLLWNGVGLRIVYAPRGESSGHLTFPIDAMCEVAGRPIVSALHMLLSAERLFSLPTDQRLPAILRNSRRFQNEVSTRLAEQVLEALHELVRGFQAANEKSGGALLRDVLREDPQSVYGGLLGTLLRLVFILYAEDRGLLPKQEFWQQHYSVGGLFERLRDDAARHPDTMEQRYGAWAQLLTLFRLIHDGGSHGAARLPPRQGHLFNPDTWDFLEGRLYGDVLGQDRTTRLQPPKVSDAVVYRVLENLLLLDAERISYSALDVEQIGSVYEAMMGFELRVARGASIGVRPQHVVVDLEALLDLKPAERGKWLRDEAACDLKGEALDAVKEASTPAEAVAALGKKVSPFTPGLIPKGGLFLQPTEERRRSGSHYTPRSLTEPIVATTLEPLIANLGEHPTPEQLLDLKVCDPAMGSGAFLVATCRYLGDALVAAWDRHDWKPALPPDEEPVVHARRLVAARCLYGVDKNPFAVDLAKLSLWLVTLARDHPFTFLDHALRHGDSLVGLTNEQIARFHWGKGHQIVAIERFLRSHIQLAHQSRERLLALGDAGDSVDKPRLHGDAEKALETVRLCADLVIAAYFEHERDKDRERARTGYAGEIQSVLEDRTSAGALEEVVRRLHAPPLPLFPFHWEMEFPEVFGRPNSGFDAFVGNPPFAGKNTLIASTRDAYPGWLKQIHEESHGNADLVAHFFRRAFTLLRKGGHFGLIATKTIAQGDTRGTGLRWICTHGGAIYAARKRLKWPGAAAVVVSVVHVAKGYPPAACRLDDRPVSRITAFLFHDGGHEDPKQLRANEGKSFQGSIVLGMGFTFDDTNPDATPIAEMERLIAKDPSNKERIFPYLGGEEVNSSPTHVHHRYVINFGEMSEDEARTGWPDLMDILERRVRPTRAKDKRTLRAAYWWRHAEPAKALYAAIEGLDKVLACSRHQPHWCVARLPSAAVFSEALVVFSLDQLAAFALLQSRPHEIWARALSSTMKDDLRYAPSDCFETLPFPLECDNVEALENAGNQYESFRAALMRKSGHGLTATYNRFHDPDERDPDILKLRELHDAMDRAVLDAYGWTDLQPHCEFLLDYEEDEDDDGDPTAAPSTKKKPWRYRWPDDIRDAVLARLLALNQQRAAEEAAAGPASKKKPAAKRTRASDLRDASTIRKLF